MPRLIHREMVSDACSYELHQPRTVDLRLAENYLPACFCLLKGFALSLCLYFVETREVPSLFVVVGVCLAIDRVYSANRIFDGSVLLWCVYASRVVLFVSAHDPHDGVKVSAFVLRCLHVCWFCAGCMYVLPEGSKWASYGASSRLVGVVDSALIGHAYFVFIGLCMCVALCVHPESYMGHGPVQSGGTLVLEYSRIFVYVVLSIVWVYVIGLCGRRWTVGGTHSTVTLVCLFSAVLYLPLAMAGAFALWAVWCIGQGVVAVKNLSLLGAGGEGVLCPMVECSVETGGCLEAAAQADLSRRFTKGVVEGKPAAGQCEAVGEQGNDENLIEIFRQARETASKRAL